MHFIALIVCDLMVIICSEWNVMAPILKWRGKTDLSCQNKFILIDFAQQIIPGAFEYALSHIVDKHLDLTNFDDWYNNDNGGAVAVSHKLAKPILPLWVCQVTSNLIIKFIKGEST